MVTLASVLVAFLVFRAFFSSDEPVGHGHDPEVMGRLAERLELERQRREGIFRPGEE